MAIMFPSQLDSGSASVQSGDFTQVAKDTRNYYVTTEGWYYVAVVCSSATTSGASLGISGGTTYSVYQASTTGSNRTANAAAFLYCRDGDVIHTNVSSSYNFTNYIFFYDPS